PDDLDRFEIPAAAARLVVRVDSPSDLVRPHEHARSTKEEIGGTLGQNSPGELVGFSLDLHVADPEGTRVARLQEDGDGRSAGLLVQGERPDRRVVLAQDGDAGV